MIEPQIEVGGRVGRSQLFTAIVRLQRKEAKIKDYRPGLKRSADSLERYKERAFESDGASTGKKWRRLKRTTQRARRRRWGFYGRIAGAGREPLEWSGKLRRAFRTLELSVRSLRWGVKLPEKWNLRRRNPLRFRSALDKRVVVIDPIIRWLREE